MTEISSWIQLNWQELGTFLVEIAFLIAAIWFARSILKTLRSFQEQIGALLRLTITPPDAPREREGAHPGASARSNLGETSPYWLTPSETQPATSAEQAALSEPVESRANLIVRMWRGVVSWMNAPMTTAQAGPWHRLVNWLRAPARS